MKKYITFYVMMFCWVGLDACKPTVKTSEKKNSAVESLQFMLPRTLSTKNIDKYYGYAQLFKRESGRYYFKLLAKRTNSKENSKTSVQKLKQKVQYYGKKSETIFRMILKDMPGWEKILCVYKNLAEVYEYMEELENAIREYRIILQDEIEFNSTCRVSNFTRLRIGKLYLRMNKLDKAISHFSIARKKAKGEKYSFASILLAIAHSKNGNLSKANTILDKVLSYTSINKTVFTRYENSNLYNRLARKVKEYLQRNGKKELSFPIY